MLLACLSRLFCKNQKYFYKVFTKSNVTRLLILPPNIPPCINPSCNMATLVATRASSRLSGRMLFSSTSSRSTLDVGAGHQIRVSAAPSFSNPCFQVIYADPPWKLSSSKLGSGKGCPPYPTMATKDICALPVSSIASPDSFLFLWAVHSHLPDALAVIRAWCFTF